ncbi:MAG: glycosyltransferase family 2 protein [Gammaproteobacteria bacterium]|nr:glycosyltransferase family 2 protein [Gammaproteobacteria bacterium]MCW8922091.1 glycosyltransferase family 2 protein [Gammaproteobacteria bacterium]
MAKISACIISYNEEKKIEGCLKSLLPVADEIIIIDSLSSDNTLKIAEKYTGKIFHQKFMGHIEQKNLAVEKASHDWVISLDCDERLTEELQQSILTIKDQLDETDADAYCMARKTFYIYRWLNYCWYPDIKTRLFNKNTAHWGGTNPHDRVITDGNNIVKLKGDIQHYSFDTLSDHIQTIDKFTEIGADEIIRKNKRASIISPFTHAFWIFIKTYFIKRGFLDGFAGILVASLSCMHVFIKYSKVIIKRKQDKGINT